MRFIHYAAGIFMLIIVNNACKKGIEDVSFDNNDIAQILKASVDSTTGGTCAQWVGLVKMANFFNLSNPNASFQKDTAFTLAGPAYSNPLNSHWNVMHINGTPVGYHAIAVGSCTVNSPIIQFSCSDSIDFRVDGIGPGSSTTPSYGLYGIVIRHGSATLTTGNNSKNFTLNLKMVVDGGVNKTTCKVANLSADFIVKGIIEDVNEYNSSGEVFLSQSSGSVNIESQYYDITF